MRSVKEYLKGFYIGLTQNRLMCFQINRDTLKLRGFRWYVIEFSMSSVFKKRYCCLLKTPVLLFFILSRKMNVVMCMRDRWCNLYNVPLLISKLKIAGFWSIFPLPLMQIFRKTHSLENDHEPINRLRNSDNFLSHAYKWFRIPMKNLSQKFIIVHAMHKHLLTIACA